MKLFVITCLVLLLAACIVKKAEGYYRPEAHCNGECNVSEDLCIDSGVPQYVCDQVVGKCKTECRDKYQKQKH